QKGFKPFCGDLALAETVAAEAEAAGTPLLVHENFRFQPWYRILRAALDAGEIGTLRNLTFRLRPGDGQGPRAYLDRQPYFQTMPRFLVHETAIHWIDTFRYLVGEPEAVFADLRRLNPAIAGEDAGHILFRLPGGARALFDGNRLLDHAAADRRRTLGEALIEGDAGALTLGGDGAVHLRRFGETAPRRIAPPPPAEAGFGGGCATAFQAHALAVLLDGEAPETSARLYLRNLRLEAAIYASAEAGRWLAPDGTPIVPDSNA
ncbi:MAG: Gfo/Idh/MocA family oxidoreductase, partial [Pseudomonadota bacterium]